MKKIGVILSFILLLVLTSCSGARYAVTGIVVIRDISTWAGSSYKVTISKGDGNLTFQVATKPAIISGGNYTLILRPNGETFDIMSITEN